MNCAICGQSRTSENEGRIIDDSWREDKKVLGRYIRKWVCSWPCYKKTWRRNKKVERGKESRVPDLKNFKEGGKN